MEEAAKLNRRCAAARASLWAVAASDVVAIGAGLLYVRYLQSLDPDALVAEIEIVPAEHVYFVAGLVQLAALVAAAVFFIRWFHLAHRNLRSFSDKPTTYDSRWAIWGFFVPIVNLFRPQQVMREIWLTTKRGWSEAPSRVGGLTQPTDRVNLWWTLFLTTSFLGNMAARLSWKATTAEQTLGATWAVLLSDGFDIGAVVVAPALVRNVTELQRPLLGYAPSGPSR